MSNDVTTDRSVVAMPDITMPTTRVDQPAATTAAPTVRGTGRFDPGRESMSVDDAAWYRPGDGLEGMDDLEWLLWLLVAVSLVGDVVTTVVGLQLGLAESNPVARAAIDGWGVAGMLALKAGAIAVGLVCRSLLEPAYRPIVPAGLAVPWLIAVLINCYMITMVA